MVVPLAGPIASASGIQTGELLDADALTSVGFGGAHTVPLDSSDGSTLGVMLATGTGPHIALLPTCARLLSYEWESISTRAELRRLGELARDRDRTDPVTGLDNRRSLMDALEREWSLSRRGTVVSYLVTTRIADREALVARSGQAAADLLLKDVAEVFTGGVRGTDYLARIDDDILASILVGCKEPAGVLAFAARCERALMGVTAGRATPVQLAYGWRALADATSAEEAIEAAEQEARDAPARPAGAMVTGSEAA
jgi:GGDEF domain-containing protein